MEGPSWNSCPVNAVFALHHSIVLGDLEAGAGGEEDGARVVRHPPNLLASLAVDGPETRGGDDEVPRHADHALLGGGDVVTEPLTPPVLQPEVRSDLKKFFSHET